MNAQTYLEEHWIKNKIWTHLSFSIHKERFKSCVSYLEGKTFIDIGCGLGHSTDIMKTLSPGDWSGLEFWEGATEAAKMLFPDIKFYHSESFDLLPVCGKFDSVVCSEVIEHVGYDQDLVNGLLAITKKVLVVTTPSVEVNDPGHLRVYTVKTLRKLFEGFDFKIVKSPVFFYVIVRTGG